MATKIRCIAYESAFQASRQYTVRIGVVNCLLVNTVRHLVCLKEGSAADVPHCPVAAGYMYV